MLSRLKQDCEYYLGNGNRNKRHLWADDEVKHIEEMKRIYSSFLEEHRPEWLTYDEILEYEDKMLKSLIIRNRLKEVLVGKRIKKECYIKELNTIVKDFDIEVNACEFDYERLYSIGYKEKDNWNTDYIASLKTEFIFKQKENEEDYIEIVDVF